MRFITAFAAGIILSGALLSAARAQTLIFDNSADGTVTSSYSAGLAPLANITVSAATTITGIAIQNDLNAAGGIKFVIFQNPSDGSGPAYSSAAKAFADDGLSFKRSDLFSFTLNPGSTYYIGGIADVGADWGYDFTGNTQNGVASSTGSGFNANFATPTFLSGGITDVHVRLYSGTASSAATEPSALALWAALFPSAIIARPRKLLFRWRTPNKSGGAEPSVPRPLPL